MSSRLALVRDTYKFDGGRIAIPTQRHLQVFPLQTKILVARSIAAPITINSEIELIPVNFGSLEFEQGQISWFEHVDNFFYLEVSANDGGQDYWKIPKSEEVIISELMFLGKCESFKNINAILFCSSTELSKDEFDGLFNSN